MRTVSATRRWARILLPLLLVALALLGGSASARAHPTFVPPPGHTITRDEILARAQSWLNPQVPYNQRGYYPDASGYREDCSGYVSMAWELGRSYTTYTLGQVAQPIGKDDLLPGDALLNRDGGGNEAFAHVLIFVGWANDAHTRYNAYEEDPYYGGAHYTTNIPYPYWPAYYHAEQDYVPVRLDGLSSGATSAGSTPTSAATSLPDAATIVLMDRTSSGMTITAVRASDRQTLWSVTETGEVSYQPPLIDNGMVLIGTSHYNAGSGLTDEAVIHALRISDGSQVWTYSTSESRGDASLVLLDGHVFATMPTGGTSGSDYVALYAFDSIHGALLWTKQSAATDYTLPSTAADGSIYLSGVNLQTNQQTVYALRESDGSVLWSYAMPVEAPSFPNDVRFANGVVYALSATVYNRFQYPYDASKDIQYNNAAIYALRSTDGGLIWTFQTDKYSSFTQLDVVGSAIYATTCSHRLQQCTAYGIQANTGTDQWHYQVDERDPYSDESAEVATGNVCIASQGTNATAYCLRGSDGTQLWRFSRESRYLSLYSIVSGVAYLVSTDSDYGASPTLDAVRMQDGASVWHFTQNDAINNLEVAGTTVYATTSRPYQPTGASNPSLYALNASDGSMLWQLPLDPASQFSTMTLVDAAGNAIPN